MRALYIFISLIVVLFRYLPTLAQDINRHSTSSLTFEVDAINKKYPLNNYLELLEDSNGYFSIADIAHQSFEPPGSWPNLKAGKVYWGKLHIKSGLTGPSSWILYSPPLTDCEVYIKDKHGHSQFFSSGSFTPASEKIRNEGPFVHIPLDLDAGEEKEIYLRFQNTDGQTPVLDLTLFSPTLWHEFLKVPRETIITFFQGVFWVMIIYNLVMFFSVRFRAYFYYAMYLLCLSLFVLFAVGTMTHPSFGNPRLLEPVGYLAFGAINIFYFLFGRSFLNLPQLLPRMDRLIMIYIGIKAVLLLLVQIQLYIWMNIPIALLVEFSMMGLDAILSLILFFFLLKTPSVPARFFVAGSASVIVIGLSLAALGHIYDLPYTFVIFLGSIVVEIIFFSMGLGYRMRQSEKEKLQAEKEKRKAQEALNEELSKVNSAFGRFVPHEFLQSLGYDSILDVNLGDGVEKEVSVFFSDIRGYTTLSEKMTPKENFDFLNAYLGRVGPIIQHNKGFVNQYYGDGIMALFLEKPDDALCAAIEILQKLQLYNKERVAKGREKIQLGIGLHTGPLMMGVIGDTLRMEAGVVADTVNTASRMEGLTKFYGSNILVSESFYKKLQATANFQHRFLGKVQVKGRNEPLGVYEFFGGESPEQISLKAQTLEDFQEGIKYYFMRSFASAARFFDQVLEINPSDKAAIHYKNRSTHYLLEGIPDGWDGVEMMLNK